MLRNSLLYDEGAREQVTQERGGMERVRRVLVSVCRDRAAPQSVHFLQSVTGHFGTTDQVNVSCSLDRNRLIVLKDDTDRGIPLKRAPFCPIKHLSVKEAASISLDIQQRGVDVGVAIILQTADKRVLLTRRAKQLRIFPNVWVPPGGHLEPDETLLEAGLRELKEETGLALEAEQFPSPKVLGVWESVYPPMLSRGPPQRHHLVVYLLLRSPCTHLQLQDCLRPSPTEVSACLWADSRLVSAMVSAVDGQDGEIDVKRLPAVVRVSEVCPAGGLRDTTLSPGVFVNRAPYSGPDVERVSTGTKFALGLWLKTTAEMTSEPHTCQPNK
ncbi:nucleoside diphosphate-linked moiety X motif 17 isoform X2 [Dunckerocampus dactyliophorus]|uniref:nucleoside diphosphate-linked moiety X motif 17 isoform X2 n=1 Tax=Dunckerocampus dactyliophorus TaxID=161453 RepID=UPI0024058418|nr:nucleoside diphosphate-linked moiety X motif 17 isoform X2 [Dunckerocampus dactyliophorus]